MNSQPAHRRGALLALGAFGVLVLIVGIALVSQNSDDLSAKVVDQAWLGRPSSGEVHYCTGEDISKSQQRSVDDFNARHQGDPRAVLVQTTSTADAAHDEYLQLLGEDAQNQCDVVYLDVIYMPEFAKKSLLYDMSPYLHKDNRIARFNPSIGKTVRYEDKLWGVPKQLDAGVLFMRTDKGLREPQSWRDLFEQSQPQRSGELPRLRFQAAGYEGLTVVFLELAYSAGAEPIISADGKHANIAQEPAIEALQAMRRAIGRSVPKEAINQADKGSLSVFEHGRALFMRSWPFAAARIHKDAATAERTHAGDAAVRRKTADNFKVVPLPPWQPGGDHVGILGGHDLVIAANAQNPRGALQLIDFLTSPPEVRQDAREYSQFPVLESVASDPDVHNETLPAIRQTRVESRPVIANYAEISKSISDGLNRALRDRVPIRETLHTIQRAVQEKLG
jgi:multiple sugar transport system substrate-binding protein